MMIYWQLFIAFVQVGALSFGGGYAALPLIEEAVVNQHQWISAAEMVDMITISQMTPGPIAINTATFVGMKMAGVPGAVIATTGVVTPSFFIVLLLASLYYRFKGLTIIQGIVRGLRPAVIILIASAGWTILKTALFQQLDGSDTISLQNLKIDGLLIMLTCLILIRKTKISPIAIMILAGILQILILFVTSL